LVGEDDGSLLGEVAGGLLGGPVGCQKNVADFVKNQGGYQLSSVMVMAAQTGFFQSNILTSTVDSVDGIAVGSGDDTSNGLIVGWTICKSTTG